MPTEYNILVTTISLFVLFHSFRTCAVRRHTPSSNERCKWNLEPVCAVSATPASVGSGCGGTNWREKKKHTAPNNTLTNECFYGATSAMRWPQQRRPCGAATAALQVLRQKRHPYHGSCNARRALPPRGAYLPWFCACGGWLCGGRSPGSASDSSVRSIAPAPANAPRARARLHGDVPRPEMHRRRLHGAGEAGGSTPRLAV